VRHGWIADRATVIHSAARSEYLDVQPAAGVSPGWKVEMFSLRLWREWLKGRRNSLEHNGFNDIFALRWELCQ
jgi:hypothetical protein